MRLETTNQRLLLGAGGGALLYRLATAKRSAFGYAIAAGLGAFALVTRGNTDNNGQTAGLPLWLAAALPP